MDLENVPSYYLSRKINERKKDRVKAFTNLYTIDDAFSDMKRIGLRTGQQYLKLEQKLRAKTR